MVESLKSPSEEYKRRERAHEARVAELEVAHTRIAYLRLALVVGFLVVMWASAFRGYFSRWVMIGPVVCFVAVAVYHDRVLRRQASARRAADIYRHGLARIEDRWIGMHEREMRVDAAESLYVADLDIIGSGSLFELICTARTRIGEDTLLGWLLEPAGVAEILSRQKAVMELSGRLDLREDMATAGDKEKVGVYPEELRRWSEAPDALKQSWVPLVAMMLTAFALVGTVVWLRAGLLAPLFFVLLVQGLLARWLKREIALVFDGTDRALKNLKLLAELLKRLEQENFDQAMLQTIKVNLSSHHVAASEAITRLASLGQYKDSLGNPFVKIFDVPMMYTVQVAFAVQRWRQLHGTAIGLWLNAVGEMEALLSLAAYRYEHPADPFPVFVSGESKFEAEELGHPLIAAAKCVRNDIQIGGETRVLLISGSNMSGKSTLMRSVGVNTVLAMCGAPVRAKALRLTPLQVGASLLMNDSLQSGHSRFYAEIARLQKICALAEKSDVSVLFLLDELLQGTNSRDRLIGAEGVVQELVRAGAIGMITTHDLSMTEMIGRTEYGMRNLHFQDEIVDGKMRFDFRLRDGVVTKSNGVELMRLIGLKV